MLPVLLITGATGFIGSHVVQHALQTGHSVKMTARPPKVDSLRALYFGQTVEVFGMPDITTGDFTDTLKGVDAVIHIASPLPYKATSEGMLKGATQGTANILEQAHKAGVKKFICTGSVTAVFDYHNTAQLTSNYTFNESDWNPMSTENLENLDLADGYCISKVLSEKLLWKFADEHPDMDIVSLLPTWTYGPLALGCKAGKGSWNELATIGQFRLFVLPTEKSQLAPHQLVPPPMTVDVRDVAKAHVLALKTPLCDIKGHKRILISGPRFTWKDAIEHLAIVRPGLAARLPDTSTYIAGPIPSIDTARSKEILGMEYVADWRKTVEDTADTIIAIEKSWDEDYIPN